MRRYFALCLLVALAFAILPATTALAADPGGPSITVPVDTVVYGEQGSVHELASVPVDASLQGSSCKVSATADNNGSVHPDSTLTIESGSGTVTVSDVESSPGKITDGDGTLVLGTSLTVSITIGPDGVFSGGVDVSAACETPPTTTSPPTTTTSPPTTTTSPPTTTTSPPIEVSASAVVAQPQAATPAPAVPIGAAPQTTG